MPRDDLPLVRPAHIDLGESPIVLYLTTVNLARPPEPPGDDCGVAVPARSEFGRLVSAEFHLRGTLLKAWPRTGNPWSVTTGTAETNPIVAG
jgi:hypothetical protein